MSHFGNLKSSLIASFILSFGLLVPVIGQSQQRQPAALHPVGNSVLNVEASIPAELIAAYNQIKAEKTTQEYAEYIPKDIDTTQNSQAVISRIADNSFQVWWNSPTVQDSAAARSVNKVEKSMTQEMILSNTSEMQHKLNFQVQAFQTLAKLDYSGFLNASLFVVAKDSKMGVEVMNKLFAKQELVLSHETTPIDQLSKVSLRWQW